MDELKLDLGSPTPAVETRRTDLAIGEKDGAVRSPQEEPDDSPLTVQEWAYLMFHRPPPLVDYEAQLEKRGVGGYRSRG